jgi:hypothetical protein
LISFSVLIVAANLLLISPIGYREPKQIYRIVREKARVQGAMASIVEWQSLKMQEYRYNSLAWVARFFEMLGVRRPLRYEPPLPSGDYEHAVREETPENESLLDQYLRQNPQAPSLGGAPKQTAPGNKEGRKE